MNRTHILQLVFITMLSLPFLSRLYSQSVTVSITKLEHGFWVLEGSDYTTMYLIEGMKKALLIDTGRDIEGLDSLVHRITDKPLIVVLTHAHFDHAGNIGSFPAIWMHPADTVLLQREYRGTINFVNDGDKFDLGDVTIEVSHMPGHTPGSIVLLDKKNGRCFSGDAFGANHVWLQLKPHVPLQIYVQSCSKMEKLMDDGIQKLYCGHYIYAKRPYDKSYITAMRELAEALLNGTAPDAKPYPQKVGCLTPMFVTHGPATIVFDPESLHEDIINKK
ncbi:MAG: MBL fold metallo-hydrolase [Bacteroidetes bacterium]|nr:MBL fold metallo-hydrolase [Bacteroidota bacterium]